MARATEAGSILESAGRAALIFALCAGLLSPVNAQNWSMWQSPKGGVRLRAQLRDKQHNAPGHVAAVEVEVQNVWLHYPSSVQQAGVVAAVLEYRLDSCPPVLTTDTRLRFFQLPQGTHQVSIALLRADNNVLLSPVLKLEVSVP